VEKPSSGPALHPLTSESDMKVVEKRELARAVVLADEALLVERKKSLEKLGLACKEISVSSDESNAASEILRLSNEGMYDLIALGSRGIGGTRSFFLGSVSKVVVSSSRCSVLVSKMKRDSLQRILLAYDGSESSNRALSLVSDLAKKFGATVRLVSVISSQMITGDFVVTSAIDRLDQEMRQYADKAVSDLRSLGISVEDPKIVGASDIGYAINQEAEGGFYDLIVLGNRGWGKVKSFFLGSVASGVLDSARTNVLVVK
ncbi:MAG: universal stress protein, partial [Nitrososphaerota archaeon]|nr:universal stress protein [Nitrososphaerota archaeon]